ncbi:hypothetical protein M8J77_009714 [Diaphorina citri]|nr:hypothetical protein M8J77_009714 [Diaphorina citri]
MLRICRQGQSSGKSGKVLSISFGGYETSNNTLLVFFIFSLPIIHLGGVPILAAGQRDPAALPSCAAAAYCFLCILMKYFPNQAAGSRCPAACCWAALPSRSESSVVALPGS